MFSTPEIPIRIADISHRQMEQDDGEVALVEWTCEIAPFTAAMAGDLHDFVKRTLYTSRDVEVNALLRGASFDIGIRPQSIRVRMAPDQTDESFTIEEAKIEGIKAKRSKKSTAWTLEFKVVCAHASEHHLAQLIDCYLKTRYVTFEDAVPTLFDETPTVSRAAQPEPAATTH